MVGHEGGGVLEEVSSSAGLLMVAVDVALDLRPEERQAKYHQLLSADNMAAGSMHTCMQRSA
jgi:hypothetical protein